MTNVSPLDMEFMQSRFPEGTRLTVVLMHVSRSGMMRSFKVLAVRNDAIEDVSSDVALTLGNRVKYGGVVVEGVGMDMSEHLVRSLSTALYHYDSAFRSRTLI